MIGPQKQPASIERLMAQWKQAVRENRASLAQLVEQVEPQCVVQSPNAIQKPKPTPRTN